MPTEIESPMWAIAVARRLRCRRRRGVGARRPSRPTGRRRARRGRTASTARARGHGTHGADSDIRRDSTRVGRHPAAARLSAMGTTTASTRTRSWWGWGYEDQAVGRRRDARHGRTAGRALRTRRRDDRPARRRRPRPAGAARRPSRPPSPRGARRRRPTAPGTPTASRTGTSCAPSTATCPTRPTSSPSRRPRPTSSPCSTGAASAGVAAIPYGGGSSVVGGVECAVGDGFAGVVSIDLGALDRVLEVDSRLAGRPDPGRRPRPGARGPAPPARLHAAPLPAVVRAVDARRLAGHPLRRPLRQRVHAHRRPRRVDARRHADRHQRVPPAARLRRRAVARPPVPRLGGQPRHHHRGVDAGAGPAALAGVGGRRVRAATPTASRRPGPSPSRRCSRRTAGCSTALEAATAAGTSGDGGAARARLRVGRPPGRRRGSTGPSSCAATTAARSRPACAIVRRRRQRRRRTRDDAVGSWRSSFLRAPYLRNALVRCGMLLETFETACTWDAFDELHATRDRDGRRTPCSGSAAAAG